MNRAAARRRGKRKEAAKKTKLAQMKMWRKLTAVDKEVYRNMDAGMYSYCPYIPINVAGSFFPVNTIS